MCQQVESLSEQTQRNGGIQSERLVADDAYVGHVLLEIGGNQWDVFVGAHQNGNVTGCCSLFQ